MKRRTFLQAAIAVPVAAMVPEFFAAPDVLWGPSIAARYATVQAALNEEMRHHLDSARYMAVRTWYDGEKMNREWITPEELYCG